MARIVGEDANFLSYSDDGHGRFEVKHGGRTVLLLDMQALSGISEE